MNEHTKNIVRAAAIAAIYTLLTLAVQPISSGLIQARVSEALCVLPYFTVSAVPGLFLGCLISNLITGAAIQDVIFGSLATLAAAWLTYRIGRHELTAWLAPAPAVIVNAVVVGALLCYVYQVGVPVEICMAYVAAGQLISCYALGMPLIQVLRRYGSKLF